MCFLIAYIWIVRLINTEYWWFYNNIFSKITICAREGNSYLWLIFNNQYSNYIISIYSHHNFLVILASKIANIYLPLRLISFYNTIMVNVFNACNKKLQKIHFDKILVSLNIFSLPIEILIIWKNACK